MLILGIDTTEKFVNIALTEDENIIFEEELPTPRTEDLILYAKELFEKVGKKLSDLNAIGVITGPGGYTGTRSGIVVAKTLSQFLKIPIVGITKTDALIYSFGQENKLVAPMIDIKRGEAFSCIGYYDSKLNVVYKTQGKVFAITEWVDFLQKQKDEIVLLASNFVNNLGEFNLLPDNITVLYEKTLRPSVLCNITKLFIENGKATTYLNVEPFYVREAV